MDELKMAASFLREVEKLKIAEKNIPLEPHWAFCYSMFQKDCIRRLFGDVSSLKLLSGIDPHAIALSIQRYLGPELRNAICVFYCVLRALDTVEDDMNMPSDVKVPILENFHRHIYDGHLQFSCGTNHHKELIDQFHHVSTAFSELRKSYQELIEETTRKMGAGMAKFILKEVETMNDYNEYCHIVAGLVFIGMSELCHASDSADFPPEHLSNSMGLILQKINIIQDFSDDMNAKPKVHMHWPRHIWSKYVDKLEELAYKENSEKAVSCLNDMVTDALSHVEDCLEYLSTLQDSAMFRFYAVNLIISTGILARCYNNVEVFRGGVKMNHGHSVKVICGTKAISDVYGAFYDYSSTLKAKIDDNDPNATKTRSRVEAIQKVCENLEMGVKEKIYHVQQGGSSLVEQQVDPFSLVADELSLIGNRLRETVQVVGVPKLASAAGYFFEVGVEGKRFRPTVLLLMASALNMSLPGSALDTAKADQLRASQQRVAEITEMIHVASLLHDDVLDDADTRRGVPSLNTLMGNKVSVLAGDFLLCRACVTLSTIKHFEVSEALGTAAENLIAGEMMQTASTSEKHYNMDQYMQKTYYKTASLIANSCKAVALLADHENEVVMLAYNYGRNLGLAYQLIDDVLDFTGTSASLGKGSLSDIRHGIITAPVLFATEEFPELQAVINRGFDDPANVDRALEYLQKSRGIQRAKELAIEHANMAASAIDSFPKSDDDNVRISRQALVELTRMVITRTK
ncbi:hypothetical protein C5167_036483 [Papaver somniferum]|uniref:Squalene synthase n=1 Tax=Papaver somniferum TaxID=3469 RepID=A0A4Y7I634_PAPSO|nr:squalene synthase 1-like [Papaver somniferum]RZC43536.1 hypothetical protein C5167_036483 [Papaver somniferum]